MDQRDRLFAFMAQQWYIEAKAVINEYSGSIDKDQTELRCSLADRITEWESAGGTWTLMRNPEEWD